MNKPEKSLSAIDEAIKNLEDTRAKLESMDNVGGLTSKLLLLTSTANVDMEYILGIVREAFPQADTVESRGPAVLMSFGPMLVQILVMDGKVNVEIAYDGIPQFAPRLPMSDANDPIVQKYKKNIKKYSGILGGIRGFVERALGNSEASAEVQEKRLLEFRKAVKYQEDFVNKQYDNFLKASADFRPVYENLRAVFGSVCVPEKHLEQSLNS